MPSGPGPLEVAPASPAWAAWLSAQSPQQQVGTITALAPIALATSRAAECLSLPGQSEGFGGHGRSKSAAGIRHGQRSRVWVQLRTSPQRRELGHCATKQSETPFRNCQHSFLVRWEATILECGTPRPGSRRQDHRVLTWPYRQRDTRQTGKQHQENDAKLTSTTKHLSKELQSV